MDPYFDRDGVTIYHGDSRLVLPTLAPESVSLVLTDPPYDRESMGLYGEAAALCAPLMKRGSAFICYCGQYAVADIIAAVSPHLRFWWMLAQYQPGSGARLQGLNVRVSWKPLLVFVKETATWTRFLADHYIAPGVVQRAGHKRRHEWAQPIEPMREIIAQLTAPGDLVLDPFAGAGTNLRAAQDLGRRAIGVEVLERHCKTMAARSVQQVLPLDAAPPVQQGLPLAG